MWKTYPLVVLETIDWANYSGSHHPESEKLTYSLIHVCGFLIEDRKDAVVVALNLYTDDGRVRDVDVIPRCCIVRMHVVPFPKKWSSEKQN